MRSTIFRVILAAMAALTAACGTADSFAPTTPPATARRTVSVNPDGDATTKRSVDQYVWLSCMYDGAGETVHVTGELRYDVHNTQDASGVYHLNIKSNTSNLTAVGLTSGTIFRGMMAERINSRAEDYLNSDVRIGDVIRFEAPGSGDAYSLMVTSHFIVDQGNYLLWEQNWNEVCR
jgi:hypothetical protein